MTLRVQLGFLWLSALALSAGTADCAGGRDWDAAQEELGSGLAWLSSLHFESGRQHAGRAPVPDARSSVDAACLLIVGFTGGLEGHGSRTSGVVALNERIRERITGDGRVVAMTFNNFRWRRAAAEVIRSVRAPQGEDARPCGFRQPLIVVHGHSWGANSIAKFARELRKAGLEISLAIYIDAVAWRNPRVPDNIRYAVNFYQRAGILRGLPLRGKSKLVAQDPAATHILGSYVLTPLSERRGWSRNVLLPLLCKQHHLLAHDLRLRAYLLDIVAFKQVLLSGAHGDIDSAVSAGAGVSN